MLAPLWATVCEHLIGDHVLVITGAHQDSLHPFPNLLAGIEFR